MSQVPTIDITRFRLNSHSSIDDYSHMGHDNLQTHGQYNGQKQHKQIPLILKKMNSVEKYVNEFKTTEMVQKQYRPKREESPLYNPSLSQSKHLQKILSKTPQPKLKENDLKELEQKCYVKYSSTSAHDSGSKMYAIENAQNQYVKLKHSIHTIGITEQASNMYLPQTRTQHVRSLHQQSASPLECTGQSTFVNSKSIYLLNKKKRKQNQSDLETYRINHHDIEKELKTSVIQQGGKKYFADLYLMKRERDKMLKEIFGSNQKSKSINYNTSENPTSQNLPQNFIQRNSSYRSNLTHQSLPKSIKGSKGLSAKQSQKKFPKLKVNMTQLPSKSYEQKMQSQEQNFVQQKILKDRSQKKQKMLKGRNMNWNVYYEMLALKKNEKDKLKGYCKFSQTYGED